MAQGLYLSQRMALTQVLAPQLQQSLALLQAPTLELQALVQQELEQNPLLEEATSTEAEQDKSDRDEEGTQSEASIAADPCEPPPDVTFDPATEKPTKDPVDDFQAEFERLTQMDQEWRDHFAATNVAQRGPQEDG